MVTGLTTRYVYSHQLPFRLTSSFLDFPPDPGAIHYAEIIIRLEWGYAMERCTGWGLGVWTDRQIGWMMWNESKYDVESSTYCWSAIQHKIFKIPGRSKLRNILTCFIILIIITSLHDPYATANSLLQRFLSNPQTELTTA